VFDKIEGSYSHSLYSTIIEKLQKYTVLNEELSRIWKLNDVYIRPLVTPQRVFSLRTRKNFKLPNLRPVLYI
jgi:hypothetical protein